MLDGSETQRCVRTPIEHLQFIIDSIHQHLVFFSTLLALGVIGPGWGRSAAGLRQRRGWRGSGVCWRRSGAPPWLVESFPIPCFPHRNTTALIWLAVCYHFGHPESWTEGQCRHEICHTHLPTYVEKTKERRCPRNKKNTFQDSVARYFSACISSIYCWAPFFSPFSSPLRSYHQGQAAYPTSDLSLSFPRPLRSSGGHLGRTLVLCSGPPSVGSAIWNSAWLLLRAHNVVWMAKRWAVNLQRYECWNIQCSQVGSAGSTRLNLNCVHMRLWTLSSYIWYNPLP